MAYTKYSLTPANNTAAPPDGAPEGMLPSAVNDTMRDMMAQIRDAGDGIRDGTYTMTTPKITGGTITGVTFTSIVVTGGSITGTTVTSNTFSSSGATITGGTINSTAIGGTTAAAGKFTTLEATGVTTVQAGTASDPAITTTGDTNTGIFFSAADTIDFAEGGAACGQFDSSANFKFNSGYGSVAIAYGCRAWVNFDGTSNSLTGTYSQSGTAITITVTSHGLIVGSSVYITFQTGTATAELFTVTSVTNANVFVVTSVTSRTTSGNCTLNFNTIRASGNVSSITDNGTGNYTVNFTTAMPDANYCVTTTNRINENIVGALGGGSSTTTSCVIQSRNDTSQGSVVDNAVMNVAFFR